MELGPAELVRDFVNTYDVENDDDELASPGELVVWLRERDLAGPCDRAGDDDLALAVGLREGLRGALLHDDDHPVRDAVLDAVLEELPLRLSMGREGPVLRPVAGGTRGALAGIAVAVMGTRADGTWGRLKVCAEGTCLWAFIDSSKNRSRAWCSMKVCGNRTKTRAYRARRAGESRTRRS
ncbi:CGNR zinc finger domain-containing protein [Streptosporangium soli]|nr:CGNR zinc finger domain-containing protein [Streptosporangium sp. KLBMP 9127]